jgi:hypothetical protein
MPLNLLPPGEFAEDHGWCLLNPCEAASIQRPKFMEAKGAEIFPFAGESNHYSFDPLTFFDFKLGPAA